MSTLDIPRLAQSIREEGRRRADYQVARASQFIPQAFQPYRLRATFFTFLRNNPLCIGLAIEHPQDESLCAICSKVTKELPLIDTVIVRRRI